MKTSAPSLANVNGSLSGEMDDDPYSLDIPICRSEGTSNVSNANMKESTSSPPNVIGSTPCEMADDPYSTDIPIDKMEVSHSVAMNFQSNSANNTAHDVETSQTGSLYFSAWSEVASQVTDTHGYLMESVKAPDGHEGTVPVAASRLVDDTSVETAPSNVHYPGSDHVEVSKKGWVWLSLDEGNPPAVEVAGGVVRASGSVSPLNKAGLTGTDIALSDQAVRDGSIKESFVNGIHMEQQEGEAFSLGRRTERSWIPRAHKDEQSKDATVNVMDGDIRLSGSVELREKKDLGSADGNLMTGQLQSAIETPLQGLGGATLKLMDSEKSVGKANGNSDYVGRKVRKRFGRKQFVGDVIGYDTEQKWYKIVYEDEDEEDLEVSEVEAILFIPEASRKRTSKEAVDEGPERDFKKLRKNVGLKKQALVEEMPDEFRGGDWFLKAPKTPKSTKTLSLKDAMRGSPSIENSEGKTRRRSGTGLTLQEGISRYLQKLENTGEMFMHSGLKRKGLGDQNGSAKKSRSPKLESLEGAGTARKAGKSSAKKAISKQFEGLEVGESAATGNNSSAIHKQSKAKTMEGDTRKVDSMEGGGTVSKAGKANRAKQFDDSDMKGGGTVSKAGKTNRVKSKQFDDSDSAATGNKSTFKRKQSKTTSMEGDTLKKASPSMKNSKSKSTEAMAKIAKDEIAQSGKDGGVEGATFIGSSTKKKFGRNFYSGSVASYDPKWKLFKVRYEDGDEEDLEWSELEPTLLPEVNEGTATPSSSSKSMDVKESLKGRDANMGAQLVGESIRKQFGGRLYAGNVMSYDKRTKLFKVKYDDGDQEDLEQEELEPLLTIGRKAKDGVELGRSDAKENLAASEPGGTLIGSSTKKKFGRRSYAGNVVSFNKKRKLYRVLYEDGDEEDLKWKDLESTLVPEKDQDKLAKVVEDAGAALIGSPTRKKFKRKFYSGSVVGYNKQRKLYRVMYEDGDDEDLIWKDLEPTLVQRQEQDKMVAGADLVGKHVKKQFNKKFYTGSVIGYDKKTGFWKVRYENEDEEDLKWTELEPILLPEEDQIVEDNVRGASLIGRSTRKKFKRKFYTGMVVSYNKKRALYRVRYEDGDEEDLEWSELEPILLPDEDQDEPVVETDDLGAGLIGRYVRKKHNRKFHTGTVIGYDRRTFYKVKYEDGDEEALDWYELKSILVPKGNDVDAKTPIRVKRSTLPSIDQRITRSKG